MVVVLPPRPPRDHRRRERGVAIIRFAWPPLPSILRPGQNGARERQAARGAQPVPVSQCSHPSVQKGWVPGAVLVSRANMGGEEAALRQATHYRNDVRRSFVWSERHPSVQCRVVCLARLLSPPNSPARRTDHCKGARSREHSSHWPSDPTPYCSLPAPSVVQPGRDARYGLATWRHDGKANGARQETYGRANQTRSFWVHVRIV
ncbi:hypothetical protein CGRA01v4_13297 [Colletotrichum graminicola]|nr:hypothetical protein CGRA01v4_13297 [Colletotrichum graminicola]